MSIRFDGTHLSSTVPWFTGPPYEYERNQWLTIGFKTSPEVLRALVPPPLVVNTDDLMSIYVSRFAVSRPYSYCEAAIYIPVTCGHVTGDYMPVLYLDEVLPITLGREIWGFPKFHADISLEVEGSVVHASVVKDGTVLLEATLHMGEPVEPTAPPPGCFILLKSIPSATGGSEYDVRQLTTAVIRDRVPSEVRPGEAKLRLGSTVSDPLGMIPVLEVVSAVYTVDDFVLDYGEVVHDYLAES